MPPLGAIRPESLRPRHLLTIVTISLVVIGCLAVLSAADGASSGSAFGYFAKALGFGIVGCAVMLAIGRGLPRGRGGLVFAHRVTNVMLIVGFVGVLAVMVPTPMTPAINGARQWIVLPGGFTFQPSEVLKPALVLHLALALARDPWRARSFHDLRPVLGVAAAGLGVIAMQDLGSAIVTALIVMTVFFAAGVSGRTLGGMVGAGAAGAIALTLAMPERIERMAVFLAPFDDRFGAGFQITNGLMAIGSGGIFGNGVGESLQKHIIPEPQTDFILPVVMEEVGLLGATVVMGLYLALVLLGLRIARQTVDPYERLVAAGLSSIVLWQAALNIWVVLGIAPLTGVPLPLISAGGTSQVLLLAVIGLLIDIDRRGTVPTVALVTPTRAPRRERPQPAAEAEPQPPRAARREREPEPMPAPGELRVVDRRPATPRVADRRPAPASVAQRIGDLELLTDGTVRLPDGRIARPRKPLALADGRVLMPDGRVVSRERAQLSQRARQTR